MKKTKIFSFCCLYLSLVTHSCCSEQIKVKTQTGNVFITEIADDISFKDAMSQITAQITEIDTEIDFYEGINEENESSLELYTLDFSREGNFERYPSILAATYPREYKAMTAAEKTELHYILSTLAKSSWAKLLSSKSSLKKAGNKIDHIHPLIFWQTIFSDEELKGYLHAIRDRKEVWKEYSSECADSLNQEANNNNMKKEFINNFITVLKLKNGKAIEDVIKTKAWNEFFRILLSSLPRSGDPDRYDQ